MLEPPELVDDFRGAVTHGAIAPDHIGVDIRQAHFTVDQQAAIVQIEKYRTASDERFDVA
jgi:hypothetical protein